MQIDHIIPEFLSRDPESFARVLGIMGLPDDFDLNSYENLLPTCAACNNQKGARSFEPSPILLVQLQRAKEGAGACRMHATESVKNRDIAKALTHLERAVDNDELSVETLKPLLMAFARKRPEIMEVFSSVDVNVVGHCIPPAFEIAPQFTALYFPGEIVIAQRT